ncbi:APC family permease [Nocardioides dongxiaopingii]|uniref:APC family permease n=1 Tax=Nocardioides TaxID=1839 RepID=UPI0010C7692A|nr:MULTISPECIES: APC family permease [Nocardioides]QCW49522.1 APC family permease [Nocardioides sp. S-1144]
MTAVPRFGSRSPFEGISRRQVGRLDLTAHSVAMLTPSLTALGTGLMLPRMVGPGFWVSTLLGFGLALLISRVLEEFASRFSSAGAAYTYVAKGLGATVGMCVGVAMIVGYAALGGFGFSAATDRLGAAWEATGGGPPGTATAVALTVVAAAGCLGVIRRGVGFSTRLTLGVEVVAIGTLVVVLCQLVARHGLPDAAALSLADASIGRVVGGVAVIAGLTVAFESCSTLGLEAERPMASVPVSMRSSLALTGTLFLAANLVGAAVPEALAPSRRRWFDVDAATSPLDALTLLVLGISLLALALCAWTALSRLLFALAREGILPGALGRTTDGGVPAVAVWCAGPLVLGVPLLATVGAADRASVDLLHAATLIMCVTYGLAAVALVPFLRRLDELRARTVLLATTTLAGVVVVAVSRAGQVLDDGSVLPVLAGLGVLGLGLVWRVVVGRRPFVRVGLHDPPVVEDVVLLGGRGGGGGR